MNAKLLIPLCATFALMAACGQRDNNEATGTDGASAGPIDDTATTPGTTTTPATPTDTPASDTPPDTTSPDTTQPSTSPGG